MDENIDMEFWNRVKDEIARQNTTQEWVAKKTNSNYRTFRGWVSREIMPNADQAVAIADALGTSVEYLVTGKRPEHLSETEKRLLGMALKWKEVLEDLDALEPQIATSWAAGIHGAAEAARESRPGISIAE